MATVFFSDERGRQASVGSETHGRGSAREGHGVGADLVSGPPEGAARLQSGAHPQDHLSKGGAVAQTTEREDPGG